MSSSDRRARVRRARLARTEARETIDKQTTKLSDINERAMQIFRVNVVLTGVLVSVVSISTRSETPTTSALSNTFTQFGTLSLFTSIVLASVTYTSTHGAIGVNSTDVIERIMTERYDYDLVEAGLAEACGRWIEQNYRANAGNALLFTLTLLSTVLAVCNLFFGAIDVYGTSLSWYSHLWSVSMCVLVGKSSGLLGQLRRWQQLANPRRRFTSWMQSRWAIISDAVGLRKS